MEDGIEQIDEFWWVNEQIFDSRVDALKYILRKPKEKEMYNFGPAGWPQLRPMEDLNPDIA